MHFSRRLVTATLFTFAALAAGPADAADAARGAALAAQWCAACHAIGGETAGVRRDSPPSFAAVARRPDVSESSLRAWLGVPHPSMPSFDLSRSDTEDLIAYIRSLARADLR
jgi:mono/diheme cytochrome c family protein